jgi:CelD/BcsL family acetyltransferase involved in cellulose biosynthesis
MQAGTEDMIAAELLAPERRRAPAVGLGGLSVVLWQRIEQAESVWRALAGATVESPGQDFGFIKLWIEAVGIPEDDCVFVAAFDDNSPVALFPLHRRRQGGVRSLGWFPGSHVGCNAPLVDGARVAEMTPDARRRLWRRMFRIVSGADLIALRSVPKLEIDGVDIFAELGELLEADTLHRASFVSFEEADRTQRNKSRRKHDRQQGDKLAALGAIEFDELDNGAHAQALMETMFQQRAARFHQMGVADPFAAPKIRAFYDATVRHGSGVRVKLHVLRLKGEVVATRYNIIQGDRMFCLISSMSEDERLRPGSPGKQCLLRVMQTVFAEGYRIFDMGEGLTDEKRHWCNVQIPVRNHYLPLTAMGRLSAVAHRAGHQLKHRVKSDPRLLAMAKWVRGRMQGVPDPAPKIEHED